MKEVATVRKEIGTTLSEMIQAMSVERSSVLDCKVITCVPASL